VYVCFQLPLFIIGIFLIGLLKLRGVFSLLVLSLLAALANAVLFGGQLITAVTTVIQTRKKMFIHRKPEASFGVILYGL
jgi:hypothetical protein